MSSPTYIVYDGECPFCTRYVKLLRLREAVGNVELVNAREADHPVVQRVRAHGIVLDEEMALVIGDDIHAGADCLNRLALMSTHSWWFNRLNAALFTSPAVSRFLYPVLRSGRQLALTLLGRPKIGH